MIARYGNPLLGPAAQAAFEKKWLVLYEFPAWLQTFFPPYQGQRVTHQWMNRDAVAPFEAVMRELYDTKDGAGKRLIQQLLTYDGGGNYRAQRDTHPPIPSIHSWYCAFDFNAEQMPFRSKVNHFTPAFIVVWKKHGWTWGGDFPVGRTDFMHFEFTLVATASGAIA